MQTIRFQLDAGDRNVGLAYLPDLAPTRGPVVIYCHGWGYHKALDAMTTLLRDRLHAWPGGGSLVAFDFFGCGETGGDYAGMTYARWADNLAAVFDHVAAQPWADPSRVAVLGVSSGTTAALRFAVGAGTAEKPAAVISIATACGLCIGMPNGPGRVLVDNLAALTAGGTAKVFDVDFPLAFFTDFIGHQPIYHLDRLKCPALFLQGGDDNPFRRADALTANAVLTRRGHPSRYVEVPGGNHGLGNKPEETVAEIVAFLGEHKVLGA